MARNSLRLGAGVLLGAGLAALSWWYSQRTPLIWRPALAAREVATRTLGDYLTRHYPGAKALVIGNPFTERAGQPVEIYAFEKASIAGLQKAFSSSDAIKVVHPELRREFLRNPNSVFVDPGTTTPLSFVVAESSFDALTRANPGYDLIVSLIGVPVGMRRSDSWDRSPELHFGLLLPDWRLIGDSAAIQEAFKSEKIAAAVLSQPGAATNEASIATGDYAAEFGRRFLLVTKENIDELLRTYPQLF